MKFKDKNNKKEEKIKNDTDIEIILGDDSELDISDVGDCMNDLRPKGKEEKTKNIVIPKLKKKKE